MYLKSARPCHQLKGVVSIKSSKRTKTMLRSLLHRIKLANTLSNWWQLTNWLTTLLLIMNSSYASSPSLPTVSLLREGLPWLPIKVLHRLSTKLSQKLRFQKSCQRLSVYFCKRRMQLKSKLRMPFQAKREANALQSSPRCKTTKHSTVRTSWRNGTVTTMLNLKINLGKPLLTALKIKTNWSNQMTSTPWSRVSRRLRWPLRMNLKTSRS